MNDTENESEALAAIRELHAKDIEASKARDFDMLLSLWTEDGVLLEPGKDLAKTLRPQGPRLFLPPHDDAIPSSTAHPRSGTITS